MDTLHKNRGTRMVDGLKVTNWAQLVGWN